MARLTHNGHQALQQATRSQPLSMHSVDLIHWPAEGLTCNGGNFLASLVVRLSRGRTLCTHKKA